MKKFTSRVVIVVLQFSFIVIFSGCATILAGKTQMISVNSNPTAAACNLNRNGQVIGSVNPTPGAVVVEKTKHGISVMCKKEGYLDSTDYLESGIEGATFGNIILGGLIGWGIDSAVGADNKYPDFINANLSPIPKSESEVSAESKTTNADSQEFVKKMELLEKLKKNGTLTDSEYKKKREELISGLK